MGDDPSWRLLTTSQENKILLLNRVVLLNSNVFKETCLPPKPNSCSNILVWNLDTNMTLLNILDFCKIIFLGHF